MKNENGKTIEILVDGKHNLPTGTKIKSYKNGKFLDDWEHNCDHVLESCTGKDGFVYEVDFSDLPPLYPHKGMEVPEEGILFADGEGSVVDVGEHGFTYRMSEATEHMAWQYSTMSHYQLERTLPKTKTVCAECHKEACECVREEGWYRTRMKSKPWDLLYWGGNIFRTCKLKSDTGNSYWTLESLEEVNWAPVNVIPEGEV
jgi:hypothetical protein